MNRATKGKEETNHELKLRLRGSGSGFKEGRGNNKQESTREPLQQCISSNDHEVFVKTLKETKTHLQRIYKEYYDIYGGDIRKIKMK